MSTIRPSSLSNPNSVKVARSVRFEDSSETTSTTNLSEMQGSSEEKMGELGTRRTSRLPSIRNMIRFTFFVAFSTLVGYLLLLYSAEDGRDAMEIVMKPNLVKKDGPTITTIPLTSATPQSPFQEVFQVYQPVLTPQGVIDSTINSTGSSETSLIDATTVATSCSQVLMVHDFAFSFGLPFVGMFPTSQPG